MVPCVPLRVFSRRSLFFLPLPVLFNRTRVGWLCLSRHSEARHAAPVHRTVLRTHSHPQQPLPPAAASGEHSEQTGESLETPLRRSERSLGSSRSCMSVFLRPLQAAPPFQWMLFQCLIAGAREARRQRLQLFYIETAPFTRRSLPIQTPFLLAPHTNAQALLLHHNTAR